jgi:hypothetical protein
MKNMIEKNVNGLQRIGITVKLKGWIRIRIKMTNQIQIST